MLSIILIAIAIAAFVAWIMSISLLIDAARAKGHKMDSTGKLWFIGLFATPIVVGLYVNALPDLTHGTAVSRQSAADELPRV